MNKPKNIEEEINLLKMKKNDLLNESKRINLELEEVRKELVEKEKKYSNFYFDFFKSKKRKEFVLYEKYPTYNEIYAYHNRFPNHPVAHYGYFNIKELAEVIKLLYSFKKQEEYKVLTFGNAKVVHTGPEDVDRQIDPCIYFLIGNDKSLSSYQEFNQTFSYKENYDFENKKIYNLIGLECSKSTYRGCNELGIVTEFPHIYNGDGINYYDSLNDCSVCLKMFDTIGIFKLLNEYKLKNNYQGIKDTLSFPIHIKDSFIAKALISMVIYKKNIGKNELSNEDYRYIFRELFNEDVDVALEIEKDIPKVLKYVPNK